MSKKRNKKGFVSLVERIFTRDVGAGFCIHTMWFNRKTESVWDDLKIFQMKENEE